MMGFGPKTRTIFYIVAYATAMCLTTWPRPIGKTLNRCDYICFTLCYQLLLTLLPVDVRHFGARFAQYIVSPLQNVELA